MSNSTKNDSAANRESGNDGPARSPVSSAAEEYLRISDLSLAFGGVQALQNVSFDVKPGSIQAIIGPNGAGKTTLLNCISGRYTPAGSIRFGRVELTRVRPHRRIHLGIARTFQNIAIFPEQTVLDNVLTGGHHRLRSGFLRRCLYWGRLGCQGEESVLRQEALNLLERLGIRPLASMPAGELAYGQQKRVELGRALMADPRLLLLDEPMAGMTRAEKRELGDIVVAINRDLGVTILMIEHDMTVVRSLSTHVVVLDFGRKIADGSPDDVVADKGVRKAYLGEDR